MKTVMNNRLLSWVCLVIALGILASCSNDDEANSGQVQLLSFGPSGVQHGDEVSFIGTNLNKVTSIELAGASIPSTSFIEHTNENIVIVVPTSAEEGLVTLKTDKDDIVSKTVLSFEVPVTIGSITSEARPGTTITVTGNFLNWVKEVWFAEDVVVTEFVSQSLTELVILVPQEAQTGPVVFMTGGTEPLIIETEEAITITLPSITSLSPNPVERGSDLTITGENLDLTKEILFKGGAVVSASAFVSVSATELVVTVPEEANKGVVTLVAHSLVTVESEEILELAGDLPPLAPLGLAVYVDALQNGWQKWGGWGGGSSNLTSTDNVRDGTTAISVTFGGDWGGPLQFGGGNSATAGYTEFALSIFGTPGTNGKKINLIVKGGSQEQQVITIVEGEWTEYKLSLASDFGSPATITEIIFQDQGWAGTLYVDHIGLR